MTAKDVIKESLDGSDYVIKKYLNDLSDEDLLVQPFDDFNPIALQLGHLISSERMFVEKIKPGSCPSLPAGFDEKHDIKSGAKNDRSRYSKLSEYIALWDAQRGATKAVLNGLSDEDLAKPNPMGWGAEMFPTVGSLLNLAGGHATGHSGQFVAVRRKLGKPIAVLTRGRLNRRESGAPDSSKHVGRQPLRPAMSPTWRATATFSRSLLAATRAAATKIRDPSGLKLVPTPPAVARLPRVVRGEWDSRLHETGPSLAQRRPER